MSKMILPKEDGDYLCLIDVSGYHLWKVLGFANNLHKVDRRDFKGSKAGFYEFSPELGYNEQTGVVYWKELPDIVESLERAKDLRGKEE